MRTLCVIHDQGDWVSTHLIPIEENDADPMIAVHKELCDEDVQYEDWAAVRESLECFFLKPGAAGILSAIEWPETFVDTQMDDLEETKATIYRAFAIREISLTEALKGINSPVIDRALALGWKPREVRYTLYELVWSIPEEDQAQVYRENITQLADDIALAVEATEVIYEQDADEFLEHEGPDAE